ncbi:MAG: CerR family C-terminal domain-containing protein [Desulfobacteraceae bacterium]|jgi:AcrR family transcriptional regulator|nr:CerR family C-terminal domain-containing protein [Desulfobacteraceae bacterium]
MSEPLSGTRERILAAAAEIFGARGFKAATTRQIAEAAGVNVAAINYHFKGKLGLYTEVLETLLSEGFARYPADMGLGLETPATQRLEAFIRSFCYRLLGPEGWGGYHGKARLIVKEMADPSPALAEVVARHIQPHKQMLVGIVRELLGPGVPPQAALACAFSIVGQCIYYATAEPLLALLAPDRKHIEARIEELAEHVVAFSLGGMEKIADNFSVMPVEEDA